VAAHSESWGVTVDEVLLMQGFLVFWGRGRGSAYHTPPYATPCDSRDRKNACCNFDHTIAWLDNKKIIFAHIAVLKLWHSVLVIKQLNAQILVL